MKFNIRDLLWLMAVVGLAVGWMTDREKVALLKRWASMDQTTINDKETRLAKIETLITQPLTGEDTFAEVADILAKRPEPKFAVPRDMLITKTKPAAKN